MMKKTAVLLMTLVLVLCFALPVWAYNPSPTRGGGGTIQRSAQSWTVIFADGSEGTLNFESEEMMELYLQQLALTNPSLAAAIRAGAAGNNSGIIMLKTNRRDGKKDALVCTDIQSADAIVDPNKKNAIKQAYSEISNARGRLQMLNPGIAQRAQSAGYAPESCFVSQMFDLSYYVADNALNTSNDIKFVRMSLDGTEFKDNFVCLIARQGESWNIIDTTWSGNTLLFNSNGLGEYAVVCAGDGSILEYGSKQSPKTGDNTILWASYIAGAVMLIAGAAYLFIRRRQAE